MARPLKMICLGAFHSGASVDSELMLVLVDTYPLLMWVPNPFFLGFKDQKIEPSPRQAAGNVLPVAAVLRSTVRMKVYFQFAR